ncbi:MAG: ATP-binding domain-containing protein [Bdellovibrionales bacterium]|nr:ATP-binding domain-containing protein [Bdellovibrionales bacterium]
MGEPASTVQLSSEEASLLEEELSIFEGVIKSLTEQRERIEGRLRTESNRARELTSQLVAATREEDKAMLASDEAVSHALRDQHTQSTTTLEKLVEQPYFARFVVEEEDQHGDPMELEYKLGFAANPDCRIVDWRKAPISKIYYEYKEGEEYSEEIQGREREGTVVLRNSISATQGSLRSVTCRYGTFHLEGGEWRKEGAGPIGDPRQHLLKNILPLITKEQFQLITEPSESALLIQGIAGSGKTTVALHRLAWLLHEDNSDIQAHEVLVLVLNPILKAYISQTLPSMGIEGVRIATYREWATEILRRTAPEFFETEAQLKFPETPSPIGISRLKRSLAYLSLLEDAAAVSTEQSLRAIDIAVLQEAEQLIARDETKLLSRDLIDQAFTRARTLESEGSIDPLEVPAFLRLSQIKRSHLLELPSEGRYFRHVVVDEVQDLSAIHLGTLVGTVKTASDLTMVGDIAQQIGADADFPGWERLQQFWKFRQEYTRYIPLTVSHRSTYPIMQFADHVQGRNSVSQGRKGRRPIWFVCRDEQQGVAAVVRWLTTAVERFPSSMTAVICASKQEAQYVLSLLKPTFGVAARLGDASSFSFEEGIIVTDVRQVKGLEFMNVLLWNPSRRTYPKNQLGRNLLYVAATRAQENLCITSWEPACGYLPHWTSKLVRGIDLASEPEEEEEEQNPFQAIDDRS